MTHSHMKDGVQVKSLSPNEVKITFPENNHFKVIITTPAFDIEAISPALIIILEIAPNQFKIALISPQFILVAMVISYQLKIFNSCGIEIISIRSK
jgi:hypothetical protein